MIHFGGEPDTGVSVLLLHGLMGRARTWWPVAQWLKPYGCVHGLDARGHGRAPKTGPWTTEQFASDVAEVLAELGPSVLIGHSMGGLHAWATAAEYPELVRAVVSEDFAPDQRGRTVETWRGHFESWPVPFESLAHVRAFFGTAGDYFTECVEEREDGYHLIADLEALYEIAAEWGRRDYWSTVEAIRCPLLLVEGEHTAMPAGQQAEVAARVPGARHLVVPGSAHLPHAEAPRVYRGAVEAFLAGL
ncbi:alpha/beta fold hydrolase [Amycolatopsis sp. FDAARGOS 1241]|uniref:alpha/beta fold hydrolase n=1 Tax=Amycolatopsis sp. FDAARGOS 1241 TaxID=2778070 RepID=UPI00194EDAAA|nr:alpha/beta hydrolase [Amycolatopsis sp. FDAARGOS 1241]QRP50518.1 alpha/beta hydrolase [Amycolatopsis sp. FDAARGOS 1241]